MKKRCPCALSIFATIFLVSLAQDPVVPRPPEYVGPPQARHAVTNRAFTGISSMAVAPNGRLWVTWYAGPTPGEDKNNYVVLATSGDNGKTWKELLTVDPDAEGPRRTFDPEVWIAPDGKLRWIWADRIMPIKNVDSDQLWMTVLDDPTSESTLWHSPVYVTKGVMMCKPIVLSTGEWVLPVCTWYSDNSSKMVVSTDQGETWKVRGGANITTLEHRGFDEHMFVERKDGSIWCLARARGANGIREAVSTDRGKTWSPLELSPIPHTGSRFFITRLNSGNLLLVKHGPIDKKTARSHLTAFISKDDGKSWQGGFMFDERASISYPDGQQALDGTIYITYDFDRRGARQILFTTFREEDVLAGKPVSGAVRLRQLVSQGSGGVEKPKPRVKAKTQVNANTDGVPFAAAPAGALALDSAEQAAFELGAQLFTDRSYTCAEISDALKGATFLRIPMNGNKALRCTRAGNVYVLTPASNRNKDSVSEELLKQGFRKVALPEVRLFNPANPGNFCTLYQKASLKDEIVTIGKWAVPLFFNS